MEENIFEMIKRLDLGEKSILEVVKEIGALRAERDALKAELKDINKRWIELVEDAIVRSKLGRT